MTDPDAPDEETIVNSTVAELDYRLPATRRSRTENFEPDGQPRR